jgi:hypothetical protein
VHTGKAAFQATVPVVLRGLDAGCELRDVQPVVAGMVELDRPTANQQERYGLILIADRLAEVGERLAEVLARSRFGLVRPQQSGQSISAVRIICFDDQVGEKRPRLVGGEVSDGFPAQGHPKRS